MHKQTIGQALRRMKKLKGILSTANSRAKESIFYYEKDPPAFEFSSQISIATDARAELITLKSLVAQANATTYIDTKEGRITLTTAVNTLQELKASIAFYDSLSMFARSRNKGEEDQHDYEYDENNRRVSVKTKLPWCSQLTKAQIAEQVEQFNDAFERLNNAVESANHRTFLPHDDSSEESEG